MDYQKVDWSANRPGKAQFDQAWTATKIVAEPLSTELLAVADVLARSHVNGGARVARFQIVARPDVAWALSRNRLGEFGFFERFFSHPAVVEAMPEVAKANASVSEFAIEDVFVSFGRLASLVANGGAYQRFLGSDDEVLMLAGDFMRAAAGKRLSEGVAWVNWRAWTSWFHDIAWDASILWFDKISGAVTVLLVTDTD